MTVTGDKPAASGPWWWERPRGMVLDVTLAVLSAAECAAQGVGFARQAGVPVAFGIALGVLAGATLVLRRRWPIAVVLVSIAVTPTEMGMLLGLVGLYSLAVSDVPRRIIALLTGMQALGALIIVLVRVHQSIGQDPDFNPPTWFIPLVSVSMALGMTAPPTLLGLYVGARRRLVVSLRERADGLERELALLADRAEERAEWARNEERTRIAREMHDVVAHRVSLMVVHAAALQAVTSKAETREDISKAAKNAGLVGDMGRQALTELRTMLGVLRSEPAAASDGHAQTPQRDASPSPSSDGARPVSDSDGAAPGDAAYEEESAGDGASLGELDGLVEQSRAAGMTVELSVEGERRGYAPQVERAAFRVVQEALTNVHKHAAGSRTRVRLALREEEVAVRVENEPPADSAAADAGLPSGGNGLLGMRERISALGGGFVSGPTEDGGFRVSAVIPDGKAAETH
ncbi:histidine kinase [Streptomyces sp. ODS28]|uniref:sensor histidine kinase n=1 Tax=Streptomyces sp. ODS28 TaxID=3136688 RepID=UPI0031ED00A6